MTQTSWQTSIFGLDKLEDSNYATWRVQIKALLGHQGLPLGHQDNQDDPQINGDR